MEGGFAQCLAGKFAIVGCAAETQCFAVPLVARAGTSITCISQSDALSRISDTGAGASITG